MNDRKEPAAHQAASENDAGSDSKEETERRHLQEALEKLSDEEADVLTRRVSIQAGSFSGPLPPPEVLREYGEVVPGLSEKIVEMADREQHHRHRLERDDLELDRREARRGQYLGAATLFALIGAALWVTHQEFWMVAIAFMAPAVLQAIGKLMRRGEGD